MRRTLASLGYLWLVVWLAPAAHALADEPAEPTGAGAVIETSATHVATAGEPRDPAHYRGRTSPTSADDVALWIPRVILFPLHLVSEYLLRLPILALLRWAEQNHVLPILEQIFHPTPDVSWSPTLSFEAGVFALPGLTASFRNLGVTGHELRIAGTFAGDGFWSAQLRDEWAFAPVYFGARGGYATRPDRAYYGLGPSSPSLRTNFRETRGEAFAFLGLRHEGHVLFEVTGGWSHEEIGPGMTPAAQITREDPRGDARTGPFDLVLVGAELRLDTRRQPEENGGVRLRATGTYGFDARTERSSFVGGDAELEVAVEVARPDRVLAARVYVADTMALGPDPVPFLHLATLGWANHRGFVLGRFRGDAALLAEVRYRYPIAYFVDVQWIASVGNVFARDFSDCTPGALTGSFGLGLRTRRTGSDPIELTVAIGTTRFDSQVEIESVRLYLSSTQGL